MSGRKSIWTPAGSSRKYRVTEISPRATHVELVFDPASSGREREPRPPLPPNANIEHLLVFLLQRGQVTRIQEWAQHIEDQEAKRTRRASHKFSAERAIRAFYHALSTKTEHSESAKTLLPQLLPSRKPSLIDKWKRDCDSDGDHDDETLLLELWEKLIGPAATDRQTKILKDLAELRARLGKLTLKDEPLIADMRRDYDVAISDALRNGLHTHPWCVEWILMRQSFGIRKPLHRLSRTHPHLERSLPRRIAGKEKELLKEILHIRLENPKISLRSVHRILKNRRDRRGRQIYTKPWSTFHKWINDPVRKAIIDPLP